MTAAPTAKQLAPVLVAEHGAAVDSSEMLAAMILEHMSYSDAGSVVLDRYGRPATTSTGDPMTILDLIAQHREAYPPLFDRPPASSGSSAPPPPRGMRRPVSPEDRQAEAFARATASNPWAKGSVNVTYQELIAARDPALAAQLKAEVASVR